MAEIDKNSKHEGILFDFDGVIADSEPLHFECWAEVLKPLEIKLTWEAYEANCIGRPDLELVDFFRQQADPPVEASKVVSVYPLKKELFRRKMLENPPISKNTIELITSLSNYKLGLVTSATGSEIEPILEKVGIRASFEVRVFAEDVKRRKPAPDAYLLAGERLGTRKILVVEDSDAGVAAGLAAGYEVLRIPHPGETADLVRAKLNTTQNV